MRNARVDLSADMKFWVRKVEECDVGAAREMASRLHTKDLMGVDTNGKGVSTRCVYTCSANCIHSRAASTL